MHALFKNKMPEKRNAMKKTLKFPQIFLVLVVYFGTYPY